MSLPKVLAIVGPTASGKTSVSLELAKALNGEIVSADSRQIYKYLDIGTAKPAADELKTIPHHFIGFLEPTQDYSAGQYGKEARQLIQEIMTAGKTPILVGGSGLYLKAVIDGLFEGPSKDEEVRSKLETRLREHGVESLLESLQKVDPESAAVIDKRKQRRIIRALEVYYITGKPISQHHAEQDSQPPFEVVQFGIQWERAELYARIDERVNRMMASGLIEEVEMLRRKGFDTRLNSLNTVGYKEVFDYMDGKLKRDEMTELIKRNTRRFAKRQLTWFRKDRGITWVAAKGGLAEVVPEIQRAFEQRRH